MIKKLLAVLLAFLASAAFAAIDINKATQADLESIKGIGPVISTKILDERKKGGPFKDWSDVLVRVKGIGEGNASKFSADGLTVNDKAFRTAAAAKSGDAKATAKTDSEPRSNRNTDAKANATADAKADAKSMAKADVKPSAKTDVKTAVPAAPVPTKSAASAPTAKK